MNEDFPAYEEAPGRVKCWSCSAWYPRYYVGSGGACADCTTYANQRRVTPDDGTHFKQSINLAGGIKRLRAMGREDPVHFDRVLATLTPAQRATAELYLAGKNATQIGEALGIAEQSVAGRMRRALEKILGITD